MMYRFCMMFVIATATGWSRFAVAEDAAPETAAEKPQAPRFIVLNPDPALGADASVQSEPQSAQQVEPQPALQPALPVGYTTLYDAQAALVRAEAAERQARRDERLRLKEESRQSGRPMIVSGAALLGAGYAVSAVVGGMLLDAETDRAGYMFIPVVGSPMVLSSILSKPDYSGPVFTLSVAMLAPAIAQFTGAALLTAGLVRKSRYKNETAVSLSPVLTPDTTGLAVSGVF